MGAMDRRTAFAGCLLIVFLLAASTGELDALREQAQLAGEAAAAHGSAKRTSKKRRQKKLAADLRSKCVAWLDQKDDLGAFAFVVRALTSAPLCRELTACVSLCRAGCWAGCR